MEEVFGDAEFGAFPGESFRFSVKRVEGVGYIRLEHKASKRCWTCEMTDVGAYALEGATLPPNTVLQYVATSLRDSTKQGIHLTRGEGDTVLQLEVLVKSDVANMTWAPIYVFPLTLEPQKAMSPTEQIKMLTTQVQELQQEVKTLKEQMKSVLAPAKNQQSPVQVATLPSPGFTIRRRPKDPPTQVPPVRMNANTPPTPSNANHSLEKIAEFKYREKKDSPGTLMRRHRRHICKVCSALRDHRRTFQTSHYCVACTERRGCLMVFLCNKVRPHDEGEYQNATCNQIWHTMWGNGERMPKTGVSSIRMRKELKTSEQSKTALL
ncbi:hypothetical protein L917_19559 [Phytophthora nicotianae]|uniref:Uncharacterized protein n=1 Tax=Phytophthora nicotianae TaxID=4792 RepID=W2K3Y1_PHYNI|nr:hypothetical protein L917_19559 [Phytophthora nicotianae]